MDKKIKKEKTPEKIKKEKTPEQKAKEGRAKISKRVQLVLDNLTRLGKLANMQLYTPTPEEVEKIFNAITERYNDAKQRFEGSVESEESDFIL